MMAAEWCDLCSGTMRRGRWFKVRIALEDGLMMSEQDLRRIQRAIEFEIEAREFDQPREMEAGDIGWPT